MLRRVRGLPVILGDIWVHRFTHRLTGVVIDVVLSPIPGESDIWFSSPKRMRRFGTPSWRRNVPETVARSYIRHYTNAPFWEAS